MSQSLSGGPRAPGGRARALGRLLRARPQALPGTSRPAPATAAPETRQDAPEGAAARDRPAVAPRGFVARATAVTACLGIVASGLGLVRDQVIARLFGAGADSDAFLAAWTVPEMAAIVLIEDATALLLVPAFSAALAKGGIAGLVRGTLPRLVLLLAGATAALYVTAPSVVLLLAPGLADPRLAVSCTRLTAVTLLTFGLAGYLSATLRAHQRFLPPAAIYVAYNAGIIATLLAFHHRWGVRSAAAGVAVGGVLMVLVQLPSFVRTVRGPARSPGPCGEGDGPGALAQGPDGRPYALVSLARRHGRVPRQRGARAQLGVALVVPVVVFTISRQAQVLVERHFGAGLPAGAISHLNYAQKVAQLPMTLSLMACTITFPAVARALATGDREGARRRVERDLTLACLVVLLGTAYVLACAPQIVQALFQRGAFDAADTAATAAVLRVYALGLLGQSLVGALIRPYFSAARPTWYPAAAMAAGLGVTVGVDAAAVGAWGAYGIAAGNATGISLTAVLLLRGLSTRAVPVEVRGLAVVMARYAVAAVVGAVAGWCTVRALPGPAALGTAACGLTVPLAFAAAAGAIGAPVRSLHHAV